MLNIIKLKLNFSFTEIFFIMLNIFMINDNKTLHVKKYFSQAWKNIFFYTHNFFSYHSITCKTKHTNYHQRSVFFKYFETSLHSIASSENVQAKLLYLQLIYIPREESGRITSEKEKSSHILNVSQLASLSIQVCVYSCSPDT